MTQLQLTKYERARILGARALQISMNAPLLIKINKDGLEKINFDSLKIAELELDSGILPISIHKPLPQKKETELKRDKVAKVSDAKIAEIEAQEEEDIAKGGEIMELANPEDESEEDGGK
ncbi:DNA-directed RNA polymerase subunit K [Candidatus Woesearchaeota archaeon]|jgi:DNA-directed RNA polymerase subunit K|nr:DNA-directed RNA polymerase subunit K [Candidatus Woesearchaeota archaeon]